MVALLLLLFTVLSGVSQECDVVAHLVDKHTEDGRNYSSMVRLSSGTSSNYNMITSIEGDKGVMWDDEYYITTQADKDNNKVISRFYTAGTWALNKIVELDYHDALVPVSMAYMPNYDCAYAIYCNEVHNVWLLQELRLENDHLVVVSNSEKELPIACYAMCVSNENIIYAFGSDASLYRIDPISGQCDALFSTRWEGDANQSAWYEERTGSIYRSVSSSTGVSLYKYSINGQSEEFVKLFTQAVAILFMTPDTYAKQDAPPRMVTGVCIKLDDTRLCGTLQCTAPTYDANGYILPDDTISIVTSIDDVVIDITKTLPGEGCELMIELSEGIHSISLYAENEFGPGQVFTQKVYGGYDNPLPVEKVMVDTHFPHVQLSWDEPRGVNGYVIDKNSLRYRVTRYPDSVVVADTVACVLSDSLPSMPQNYYYGVVAYLPHYTTDETYSDGFYYDCIIELPYKLKHWDRILSEALIVEDVNEDGATWEYYESPSGETSMRYHYSGVNDADDYMYSPIVHLPSGKMFELTVYMRAGSEKYSESFAIGVSPDANIDNHIELLSQQTIDSKTSIPYSVKFSVAEDDVYRVYVHCTSPANHYMLHMDGFSIAVCGEGKQPQVPAMRVSVDKDTTYRVNIEGVTPTHCVDGSRLSGLSAMNIYRNSELIYSHPHPTLGDTIAYCDSVGEIGYYTYRAEVVNDDGISESMPCEVVAGVASVPFYHPFDDGAGFFNIVDNNNDGVTWHHYEDRFMGCMRYVSSDDEDADDWLISPPIYFDKAMRYQVEYNCCAGLSFYPESMRLLMGRASQPNDFSIVLDDLVDFTFINDSLIVVPFDIYVSGCYRIAFQANSYRDSYSIMLRSMAVNEYDPATGVMTMSDGNSVWGCDGGIVVQCKVPTVVSVCDVTGYTVCEFVSHQQQEYRPLPDGIYIVRIGDAAHKVVVR